MADDEPEFTPVDLIDYTIAPITARGISVDAARRYGYGVGRYKGKPCHVANWYDDAGTLVGQKIRTSDPTEFVTLGKVDGLYGKTRMRSGGKMVVITEGELDCLAVSDVMSNNWPVVSLPHGAKNAKKYVRKDIQWLESFEKVILCFDNDEAGQNAVKECRELFTPGKAHIVSLARKDPCEYLQNGDRDKLVAAIWGAQKWTPAGILSGTQILRAALDRTVSRVECGWAWPDVDRACSGLRYRELVTITAGTGVGKSTFCREMAAHLLSNGITVGYVALEESPRTTSLGIFGIHAGANMVTDYDPDNEAIRAAYDAWGDHLFLYDHFGSVGTDELLSNIKYMIVGLGCRAVILDHLSIVVSGLDIVDERKAIDVTMTKLRTLVEQTGALLLVVSHLKRPQGKGHEEGEAITLAHLRGSSAIGQLSDLVLGLERNQQDEDSVARNHVAVRVLKNRFSGRTGIAGVLSYDPDAGRLTPLVEETQQDGNDFDEF